MPGRPQQLAEHGTYRRYQQGCHQNCCRKANALRTNLRRLGRVEHLLDGTGTRRRVRALRRIGWRNQDIADAAGLGRPALARLLQVKRDGTLVTVATARAVQQAYSALSMTPGGHEQATRIALAEGWPPPLAWDDETIDDPDAQPVGVRTSTATRATVDPGDVEQLAALGYPRAAIAQRIGVQVDTLQRSLERAGRRDLWLQLRAAEHIRREGAAA